MKVFDLLLNADLDLAIEGGDLVIGESTEQHQQLLMLTEKGEWRERPFVGAGINTMLLDDAPAAAIIQAIQSQMELDGQVVTHLALIDDRVELIGYYPDSDG
ncbi:hypothetical protein QMK33_00255 [Hymenobacter sp. H14-R3]|uniref:hypothetical protein n=1 Tax=Hymenobacter sp. H14-R3 TaxID=3046308 RepID=UPI0024BB8B89|nr:hypothetical protein [Hymenobacter sp. H14-R3]MDJ0363565.1 hypothetical protein [Hymenobacter sp. H14-R3]